MCENKTCECKEKMKYNGWSNYETWRVALWFNNDEGLNRLYHDRLKCFDDTIVRFSDWLKSIIESYQPNLPASMFSDLLNCAISRADLYEIAKSFMEL